MSLAARLTSWLASLLVILHEGNAITFLKGSEKKASHSNPKVGLVITVHQPKFNYVARFLEQYAACPAAMDNMMVSVVFSDENDWGIFKDGVKLFDKKIPVGSYIPVVSDLPRHFDYMTQSQNICAWKKFYGIADLMDMEDPPEYGIISDSELLILNQSDCGKDSKWYSFYDKIHEREMKKEWPAVQIDETNTFAFNYLKRIMGAVETWVDNGDHNGCTMKNCKHLDQFHSNVTFSWWTELPWMNLKSAGKMFSHVRQTKKTPDESWKEFVTPMNFSRYDHIAYQYWTVLHDDFHFVNVTNYTGKTFGMATFLEAENRNGSRVADLRPLWVSDRVWQQTIKPEGHDRFGEPFPKIDPFSVDEPPYLLFHADLGKRKITDDKFLWTKLVNESREHSDDATQ